MKWSRHGWPIDLDARQKSKNLFSFSFFTKIRNTFCEVINNILDLEMTYDFIFLIAAIDRAAGNGE